MYRFNRFSLNGNHLQALQLPHQHPIPYMVDIITHSLPRDLKTSAPKAPSHQQISIPSAMRIFLFFTLPLLSSCNSISKVSTPYGTWSLSVIGGFAVSGFKWQDMRAEFTYSEHIGPRRHADHYIRIQLVLRSKDSWVHTTRHLELVTTLPSGQKAAYVDTDEKVSDITLHKTVKDPGHETKSVAVAGTSQIEYRCGLNAPRACAASIIVETFPLSG
ncbi:hypothetical protein QBC32DRAFT_366174 [Pseudoneurospora amorphoporcata]|uniref:Uncharacterized protein n=1 Tax=Pseudoneurospora amorphoporcata TaxID=241081 RepID=A0AAN6SAA6_9PEZI|nr:hypothetical protein QBC32DRAFT_366174 [Pseudoneurospora amorphoporcata]